MLIICGDKLEIITGSEIKHFLYSMYTLYVQNKKNICTENGVI